MRTVVLVLVMMAASGAHAEWARVDEGPKGVVYADAATLRRDGDKASMWDLQDFRVAQSRPYGTSYLSQRTRREYDCAQRRARAIEIVQYAGNMAAGDVTSSESEPGEWEAVAAGLLAAACGR